MKETPTSLLTILRNLLFYPAFYIGSIPYILWATLRIFKPHARYNDFAKAATAWCRFHRRCARFILGIEVIEDGPRPDTRLPESRVLYAMKHESFFEALDAVNFLRDPVVFAKQQLLSIPLWGRVGRHYGLVAVDRAAGAKALRLMLTEARTLTADGRPLLIFPEGTRVPHGTRPPLQSGFAGLYKLLALPVVPVAVDSGPLYHRWWKRSGTIHYRFGEPIPPGLPRAEIEARVLAAINVLNG
jgi:1-acyl-sn-glycerol-3-phosphate acyltransferase